MHRPALKTASKYMLSFTVPVLFVGILLIWYDFLYARQEGQRIAASSLQQLAEINDSLVNSCENLLETAGENERLAQALLAGDSSYLSSWIQSNEAVGMFPIRIALYRLASTNIFTADGEIGYAAFEAECNALSASLAGMFVRLNMCGELTTIPLHKQNEDPYGFAVLHPLCTTDNRQIGTICILISNQTLKSLAECFFSMEQVSLAILNSARSPLYLSADFSLPVSALKNMHSTLQVVSSGRNEKIVLRYFSQKTQLIYFLVCPSEGLYGNQLRWMLYLMIGLTTLCSGILCLNLSFAHQRKLHVADSENEVLNHRLHENTQVIRNLVLEKMLEGSIKDRKQLDYSIHCAGITLEKPYFQIAAFQLHSDAASGDEWLQVNRLLSDSSGSRITCYCCPGLNGDFLYAIFNCESADPEYARQFLLRLWSGLSFCVSGCGLSTIFGNPLKMNQGVIEAIVAFHEKSNTRNGISLYTPVDYEAQHCIKSISREKSYIQECLKNGNEELLLSALREVFRKIKDSRNGLEYAKCCYYDIINLLIEQATEYATAINEDILQSVNHPETPLTLEKALEEEFVRLCQISALKQQERAKKSKYNLMDYVIAHYTDPALSLTSISVASGLSASYVSRLFKEETGCTFVSYVHNLRIQNAKRILESTELLVKDIAAECGFVDQTNFIRCFKLSEGITPSEYRKLKKENSLNE